MYEKVNPSHPDKIADRIAGAIVDLAYSTAGQRGEKNPTCAVEVLIGHGQCTVIIESSEHFKRDEIAAIVDRIAGYDARRNSFNVVSVTQDVHLADNQKGIVRCGDNGIFKGVPFTDEQWLLAVVARKMYKLFPYDGKYIINHDNIIVCQSNATNEALNSLRKLENYKHTFNPLGYWTGGTNVDSGCTNRKLGSDMGDSVTGGGIHGKDLSKADVSVNIWCWLEAQRLDKPVTACCAIGDTEVNGVSYDCIVETARNYIKSIGGFEKFAEWGLIR